MSSISKILYPALAGTGNAQRAGKKTFESQVMIKGLSGNLLTNKSYLVSFTGDFARLEKDLSEERIQKKNEFNSGYRDLKLRKEHLGKVNELLTNVHFKHIRKKKGEEGVEVEKFTGLDIIRWINDKIANNKPLSSKKISKYGDEIVTDLFTTEIASKYGSDIKDCISTAYDLGLIDNIGPNSTYKHMIGEFGKEILNLVDKNSGKIEIDKLQEEDINSIFDKLKDEFTKLHY